MSTVQGVARRTGSVMAAAPLGAAGSSVAGVAAASAMRHSAIGAQPGPVSVTATVRNASLDDHESRTPSFVASRPRPGSALVPVTRRVITPVDRPVGMAGALAGMQVARRHQAGSEVGAPRPTASETSAVRRARLGATGTSSSGRGRTTIRRSTPASSRSGSGGWSASEMAARLERGENVPTQIERVMRREAMADNEAMGVATIESAQPSVPAVKPSPDSPEGMLGTGPMSTSRMLDIQSWITGLVEERLALELERRGLSGDRW